MKNDANNEPTYGLTPFAVLGSLWTNPPTHAAAINLTMGTLTLSNGMLLSPLIYNVAVSNNNDLVKISALPTNSLTGSINAKTGAFTIKFGNGSGKAATVGQGTILQSQTNGAGFFVTKANAGVIVLEP